MSNDWLGQLATQLRRVGIFLYSHVAWELRRNAEALGQGSDGERGLDNRVPLTSHTCGTLHIAGGGGIARNR
jgi:hypothetical protein